MVEGAVAIIGARGGSKRIPRKNIIDFGGRPLIAWSIDAALKSGVFRRVVVSTDDPEIADVARANGADVPFLRDRYADDLTPISVVVADALASLKRIYGEEYLYVAQVMANCPLRTADDIRNAYAQIQSGQSDFQISCFEFGWMSPWWAFKIDAERNPSPLFPEALKRRSQDLEQLYCITGAVWFAKTEKLLQTSNFMSPGYRLCPISWQSAIDIDTYSDLEMANAVRLMREQSRK